MARKGGGYSAPKGSPNGGSNQTQNASTGNAASKSGAAKGQTTYSSTGNAGAGRGGSKRPTVVNSTNQPMPPGPIPPPTNPAAGPQQFHKGVGQGAIVPKGSIPTTGTHHPVPKPTTRSVKK